MANPDLFPILQDKESTAEVSLKAKINNTHVLIEITLLILC